MVASTSEVYGDPDVHPQPETYWGNVNPVGPRACYDEAKRFSEAATTVYRPQGVDTGIIRIFNTFGPRMRADDGRAVPTFIRQALAGEPLTVAGDGSQTRSLCFVGDLVDGVLAMMRATDPGPVNLGDPMELSILQLALRIVSNPLEWNWLLIKTIARLGRAPVMRFPLDWSPVDAVARAIVHLTGTTGGSTGPYHLVTPSLLTHSQVYAWMEDFGLAAETVEYEDWLDLAARAAPTLPTELRAFVLSLPDAEESAATPYPPRYQSDRTHQLLANAGLTYPPVDQELFTRYLALGVERGELPGSGTAVHAPQVSSR